MTITSTARNVFCNLLTSNLILVETFNLLSRTIGSKATVKFGDALKTTVFLTIEPVTSVDWERGWGNTGLMLSHSLFDLKDSNFVVGLIKGKRRLLVIG